MRARTAVAAAWTACVLGVAYAAISVYWGVGGTALLGTLGGALEREARSGSAGSLALVWGAAALKLVGALLPIAAVRFVGWTVARPSLRVLCWIEAVVLTAYGLALTSVGLAVQAGVIPTSDHPDRRALAWHAFLWDPWFLAWGVCALVAVLAARRAGIRATSPSRP